MCRTSRRGWLFAVGLILAMGVLSPARAGYFVNAGAGSPLEYYFFGDANQSTYVSADAGTFYTDGTNVFSSAGSSTAILSTGTLHSSASADYGYDPGGLPNDPGDQFGNSSFGDGLTFLGNFTGQTATFHVSVDGTWSGDAPSFNASDFQFMILPSGTIDDNAGNTLNIFNNPGNVAIVNDTFSLSPASPNLSFDVDVTLNGLNPTFEFAANLNINPFASLGQIFTADYGNTASISLTAPPGVEFVSSSGVFPGSVPEPSSFALALAGLLTTVLFARLRASRRR
jgi:hypothetical protein